ncbi:DUF2911 domain-containing protein [Aquimarina algicola]|uniref:DUF2911 domain-containing protein n=1 Tax=Aquimarina algicola TaxID=2589995 RepID=A0A504JQ21_9FLAO|nr:DUF2911 domain-containing protein [Aquimarina algicola]TPN88909.1 DUF2911 domain-containing protein [Aquimarina algicola]
MSKIFALLITFLTLHCTIQSQTDPVKDDLGRFNRPTTSQRAEVSQKIGLDFIKINYGRPNVKKRKIFGGLLKYGKIWRLGADYQTVIDFQNEYIIEGDTISKGKYALYAIPNEDNWTIFFNKDTEGWGQYTYKPENNVYELNIPVEKSPEFTETFTIGFLNTSLNNGELYVQWENSRIKIPITVSNKHRKEIENNYTIALGLNEKRVGYKYYLASEYLFLEDKNYEKALTYIQKAIDSGNTAFYTHFLKGEILLAMGDKKAAVASAIKAKENLWKNFSNPEWENKIDNAIKNWGK